MPHSQVATNNPGVREATILVPLGYSPIVDSTPDKGCDLDQPIKDLLGVVGHFGTVRFQTLRFGGDFFEVTITRFKSLTLPSIVDTVAGKIGDSLVLSTGEILTLVSFKGGACLVELHFWSNT